MGLLPSPARDGQIFHACRKDTMGRHNEAEELVGQALKLFEQLGVEFPRELYFRQETAMSRLLLAFSLKAQGRLPEAVENFQQAVVLYAGLVADSPDNLFWRTGLAFTHVNLGHALKDSRRTQDAEDAYRQAVSLHEKLVQEAPKVVDYRKRLASSQSDLAHLLWESKRMPEAERCYRRALDLYKEMVAEARAEPDYWYLVARQNHGLARRIPAADPRGEVKQAFEQAVQAYREALPLYQKRAADLPTRAIRWQVADCQAWLGEAHREAGQPEEAIKVWRESASVMEKLVSESNLSDDCWQLAVRHEQLGDLFKEIGRHPEAERAYRDALAVLSKLVADYNVADHRLKLPQIQVHLVENNPNLQNNIAWHIVARSDATPQAVKLAVGLAEKAVARAPDAILIVNTLGTAYYRAGDWNAAIDTLKRADELYGGSYFSHNAFFIAMANWQRGDKEQALKWYAPALVWMEKHAPKDEELIRFRAEAAALLVLPEKLAPEQELATADDVKFCTLVLEAHPKAAWAYLARGVSREAEKQDMAAKADYRQALDLYTKTLELVS